jgi:hypothetical protein
MNGYLNPYQMIRFLFLVLFLSGAAVLGAQPFFEDAAGKSSILLPVGGIVRLNTADNSLKLGYYFQRSDKDLVFGMDASGKSYGGFASLWSDDQLSTAANVNFIAGYKNVTTSDDRPGRYDFLSVRISLGASKYLMISPGNAYSQQVSYESFNPFSMGLAYNYLLNGNMVFGLYGSYDKTTNLGALPQLTVKETTVLGSNAANTISRTAEKEYAAWAGELKKVDQFSLYLDYVYIPDFLEGRLALSCYSRSSLNASQNNTNGGFGLYLNQKDNPLKIVGGIIYEFQDLLDEGGADTSLGERGTLGLVVGYHF